MDAPEGVKFVLMVNKQGHTRFSKWMQHVEDDPHKRRMMEYELVRKCMPRDVDHVRLTRRLFWAVPIMPVLVAVPLPRRRNITARHNSTVTLGACSALTCAWQRSARIVLQANFIQYRGFTVVYRRYASLFFMVGIDNSQVRCRVCWSSPLAKHVVASWRRQENAAATCFPCSCCASLRHLVPILRSECQAHVQHARRSFVQVQSRCILLRPIHSCL